MMTEKGLQYIFRQKMSVLTKKGTSMIINTRFKRSMYNVHCIQLYIVHVSKSNKLE